MIQNQKEEKDDEKEEVRKKRMIQKQKEEKDDEKEEKHTDNEETDE